MQMILYADLVGAICILLYDFKIQYNWELSKMIYNILDFGAVGDAATVNTEAIQKAIDVCAENGGGIVTVPTGVFMTKAIHLRSHVELFLEKGATLRATLNVPDDFPDYGFIYAEGVEDVGISGYGTIDGHSDDPYYQRFKINDPSRPNCVFFKRCKQVSVRGIRVTNSGNWTIRLLGCDGVKIEGVTIYCLKQPNNDGIDVDARNVTISNCIISCDDDGICLKSDLKDFIPENITVTNCVIASNCNPIKLGTTSYSGFRNVTFSNCVIRRTEESNVWEWSEYYRKVTPGTKTGLSGIAVECADGGIIENVSFSNIVMEGIITPIFVCLNHRHGDKGVIRNLQFHNITARAEGVIPSLISGVPGNIIEGIIMRDIVVEHEGGDQPMKGRLPENWDGYPENRMYGDYNPAGGLYIRHARDIVVDNFQVRQRNTDYRPVVVLDDVNRFHMRGLKSFGTQTKELVQTFDSDSIIIEK